LVLAGAIVAVTGCGGASASPIVGPATLPTTTAVATAGTPTAPLPEASTMTTGPLTLTSEAFKNGGSIPAEYSCQGADHSPALAWSGVPDGTGALVLVVDDPDANDFTHWIVVDLAPSETGLQKGIAPASDPPEQGRNDFGRVGWGGPCPPSGTHHYRFTLTAVAKPLQLDAHPSRSAVDTGLSGATVLGTAVLTGLYRRS
jgi:Raf kinase inhibitor-like YbhB/YbcL family protein